MLDQRKKSAFPASQCDYANVFERNCQRKELSMKIVGRTEPRGDTSWSHISEANEEEKMNFIAINGRLLINTLTSNHNMPEENVRSRRFNYLCCSSKTSQPRLTRPGLIPHNLQQFNSEQSKWISNAIAQTFDTLSPYRWPKIIFGMRPTVTTMTATQRPREKERKAEINIEKDETIGMVSGMPPPSSQSSRQM